MMAAAGFNFKKMMVKLKENKLWFEFEIIKLGIQFYKLGDKSIKVHPKYLF